MFKGNGWLTRRVGRWPSYPRDVHPDTWHRRSDSRRGVLGRRTHCYRWDSGGDSEQSLPCQSHWWPSRDWGAHESDPWNVHYGAASPEPVGTSTHFQTLGESVADPLSLSLWRNELEQLVVAVTAGPRTGDLSKWLQEQLLWMSVYPVSDAMSGVVLLTAGAVWWPRSDSYSPLAHQAQSSHFPDHGRTEKNSEPEHMVRDLSTHCQNSSRPEWG